MSKVGVVLGSDSDLSVMQNCFSTLDQFEVEYEVVIYSAHRSPENTIRYGKEAAGRGLQLIIAAAGKAAHLPGVLAAHTLLPVIGVPVGGRDLGGADALYSIVQMPAGVPVATVGINSARNAALLAIEILALQDGKLKLKLSSYRQRLAAEVKESNSLLQKLGVEDYRRRRGK